MTARWASLLAVLLVAGCGGDGVVEPFVVEVVAPNGDDPDNPDPVFLNAVDELELQLIPDMRSGQSFEEVPMRTFDDGRVTAYVTSTGRYLMRFSRSWVVDHASPRPGGAFDVQIPLFSEGPSNVDPEVRAPVIRVTVLRSEARIAETPAGPPLPWPLPPGGDETVHLECVDGFEAQCRNED